MDKTSKAAICGILFFLLIFIGIFTKNIFIILLGIASLIAMFGFAMAGREDLIKQSKTYFYKALKENSFTSDKARTSYDWLNGIAISEEQRKIAYLSRMKDSEEFTVKLLDFKDIIEAKVITNHEAIISTSIGSSITRGVAGGFIAGGIGSIIGASTARKTSSKQIKELTLEFVVDDLLHPRYTVTFYKSEKAIDKSNSTIQDIETWYRTFSVIINRNNEARSV